MTRTQLFPELDAAAIVPTRDALHAYALVVGDYPAACRARRKHWWHISLRPSLEGLTTGVIYAAPDFELELNLKRSLMRARSGNGAELSEELRGQPPSELAQVIRDFLNANGLAHLAIADDASRANQRTPEFSAEIASNIAGAWRAISAAMVEFRAGIREETSPIQLWSHHFDLAMMWLPGEHIPGQDPADEENADKQMNFGFTLGDSGIAEPYFYITAYPLPEALPKLKLPAGTTWHTEGFSGAVLPYRVLTEVADPNAYLLDLWNSLLSAGREHMITGSRSGHSG